MDGENNGKPYFQMDDLGGKPTIFGNIHLQVGGPLNHWKGSRTVTIPEKGYKLAELPTVCFVDFFGGSSCFWIEGL